MYKMISAFMEILRIQNFSEVIRCHSLPSEMHERERNATVCQHLMCDLDVSLSSAHKPSLLQYTHLSAVKGEINSLPCHSLSAFFFFLIVHTHTQMHARSNFVCTLKNFSAPLHEPFEKLQLCPVTSSQTETQVLLPVFMWFPNNLGLPMVPHKNVEGAITLPAL